MTRLLTRADLLAIAPEAPDRRYRYGSHSDQVADLYLPGSPDAAPAPVAVLIHGGCWRSGVDRTYFGQAARALSARGIASWNVEYRRLGAGGGWRETLEDAAAALDLLRAAAGDEPLDLARVVAVGHSAGGHLALWLSARASLSAGAPGAADEPLPLHGVLALAGIPDLARAHREGVCDEAVAELLGGPPDAHPERLRVACPAHLPPTSTRQVHLVGERDTIVPPAYVRRCVEDAASNGQATDLGILRGCGHMEPVVAGTRAWPAVLERLEALLAGGASTAPRGSRKEGLA